MYKPAHTLKIEYRDPYEHETPEEYLANTNKEWDAFVKRNGLFERFKVQEPYWKIALEKFPPTTPIGDALRRYGIDKKQKPEPSPLTFDGWPGGIIIPHSPLTFYGWPEGIIPHFSNESSALADLHSRYFDFTLLWAQSRFVIYHSRYLSYWDFVLDHAAPLPWAAVLGGNSLQPRPWDAVLGSSQQHKP